jgi:glyoxylase-like metal-dependent hydrolase (beta-lactamase superfamily II)
VELEQERLGAGPVTVLYGAERGKYPQGNTLLVEGDHEALVIDPSLGLVPRRDALPRVARVVNSHCHEDHIAGNFLFPGLPWHLHELDCPGIRSLDAMLQIYGYPPEVGEPFRKLLVEEFHFTPCAEPVPYRDGHVFDLGGARVHVLHTPGHTRGHSCLHVRWDGDGGGVLYLGDIDLSSFGPYYGDAWSDLEDFERSIQRVRGVEARWYATFHHVGVVDRARFLERLERFAGAIPRREAALLDFLRTPHTLDRFVYRASDPVPFAEAVERRSMAQHLARLVRRRRVEELSAGRYRTLP